LKLVKTPLDPEANMLRQQLGSLALTVEEQKRTTPDPDLSERAWDVSVQCAFIQVAPPPPDHGIAVGLQRVFSELHPSKTSMKGWRYHF